MRRIRERVAFTWEQSGPRAAVAALMLLCATAFPGPAAAQTRQDRRAEEARRREAETLLKIADAAMSGHGSSDFPLRWSNDFFKAQSGTFVPFTITIDRTTLHAATGLMYVRAARREAAQAQPHGDVHYPCDLIFPVELSAPAGQPLRSSRGALQTVARSSIRRSDK